MRSSSLHDLLTAAEAETAALLSRHVDRAEVAPSWPPFTAAAARALSTALAQRVGVDPVDRAIRELADQTRRITRAQRPTDPPDGQIAMRLFRISELLHGAADLMSVKPPTDPDVARLAGARVAAVIAACAHLTATARGPKQLEPICLDAIRLQSSAAGAVDLFTNRVARPNPAILDEILTLPAPTTPATAGGRYAAAAANWRQLAADDTAPSKLVLAHSAEATGAACHAAWQVTAWNLAVDEPGSELAAIRLRATLIAAAKAWRAVAATWDGLRTGGPTTQSTRAAAVELHRSRAALLAQPGAHDHDAVTGAQLALTELATLGNAHRLLTHRLTASGHLYIRARTLPPSEDLIEAILRDRWVPASADQAVDLTSGYARATQLTASARRQFDATLQTSQTRDQTPRLEQLVAASTRPRAPRR